MTVLREGLESVIFLFGVGNASPLSIPISGLIGILCGLSVGVVIYYSGKKVWACRLKFLQFGKYLGPIHLGIVQMFDSTNFLLSL